MIRLAGQRNIAAAAPALRKAAEDPDPQIRAAALVALGFTIQFDDLPLLIQRVANPPAQAEEVKAAEEALRMACERMPDREACAGRLAAAMEQAPVSAQCRFLEILSLMGGPRALQAVQAAAGQENLEVQDKASQLLGEWMTLDAAPVLWELSRNAPDEKYQIRALRGYIRLARQFPMPDAQRTQMCRMALDTATRDAEKKLVLEVLERYPSIDMLALAVEMAKTESLKDEATGVALAIAPKIGGRAQDVRSLLTRLGQKPVQIEIIKAEYGAGSHRRDVTDLLRKHVGGLPLIALPSSSYNTSFGGDPAPGVVKQLTVQYRIDGKAGEAFFAENAPILLAVPGARDAE